jgi:hypothetical protein
LATAQTIEEKNPNSQKEKEDGAKKSYWIYLFSTYSRTKKIPSRINYWG